MRQLVFEITRFVLLLTLMSTGIGSTVGLSKNVSSDQKSNAIIPKALNFQSDLSKQQLTGRIILLYVSAPDCVFCKKLEKEVLLPLLRSGDYADKIILRKIEWHGEQNIIDFDGAPIKERDFMSRYNIQATPTLLFLGANGTQYHQPLLGYRGGQFYWYYFDAAIKQSNRNLENPQHDKSL